MMFPGMNPRVMKQAMQRMGIQQEEVQATEVIIRLQDKDLVFISPNVSKINMMGQHTYQIVGEPTVRERDTTPEITQEDIATVMKEAGVDKQSAEQALKKYKGDIAEAIMGLQDKG